MGCWVEDLGRWWDAPVKSTLNDPSLSLNDQPWFSETLEIMVESLVWDGNHVGRTESG